MTVSPPQARLATLPRVDGSATYAYGGYTVTASANGPIEAQRRDEDPDEAHVDVIVRPAAGVGGPSERNLESILQKTLSDIILVHEFPRCTIQVVLQLQSVPENDYVYTKLNQPGLNLPLLPALIQTAVLALLSANIPMRTTATATALAIMPRSSKIKDKSNGTLTILENPSPRDVAAATSFHVFAFSAEDDQLLLAESEGAFTMDEWDEVREAASQICCRPGQGPTASTTGDDMALDDGPDDGPATTDMRGFLRSTVVKHVEESLQWKLGRA